MESYIVDFSLFWKDMRANWILDSDEIKSTSRYVFTVGGGAITSKSAKQTKVTKYTMESGFIALELAGNEAKQLKTSQQKFKTNTFCVDALYFSSGNGHSKSKMAKRDTLIKTQCGKVVAKKDGIFTM